MDLSEEEGTKGFNLIAGQTWIYPTNYPVRDYQHNITEAALLNNTLVSLPTGLGKTFIAAVVMYNYFRWYPTGKIIFMAPTKPLVAQQIDACYNITAIPKNATIEMTGAKASASRIKLWKEKRVFFITPHILQNDIDTVIDLAPQIRCIVIDEAHRALGKNANCEAIKKIQKVNSYFRILALSATPGSNYNSIKDVITNLLISHIEVRTNESVDVAPYVFQRKLDRIVIPIRGKLAEIKEQYIMILDCYTRPLFNHNIIGGNCANITKGRIVMTMKEFKEKGRHHPQYGFILRTLNICVTLYHGYELLVRHGLRAFLVFFREHLSKPLIHTINELHNIIQDVENFLGPIEDVEMLPDGTIPDIIGEMKYSHPKFEKLAEVLNAHFNQNSEANTRAMVFCEYRESVMEIFTLLLRYRPIIKPKIFLGQGAISQAQQIQAVKMFKSGQCNTLVSTCIGEEGLDVGEVDLIICFDISSKSPIRMVQRMGRTGRQRDGRVVALITEGKEQQLLSQCLVQKNAMNSLLESQQIKSCLYQNNPKLVPNHITPECNQMYITIQHIEEEKPKKKNEKKGGKKNNNALKSMFEAIATTSKNSTDDKNMKESPKKAVNPVKKQSDIRSMFSKLNDFQSMSSVSQALSQFSTEEITEDSLQLKSLINEIKSLNLSTYYNNIGCEFCDNLFDCKSVSRNSEQQLPVWKKVDDTLLSKINSEMLIKYAETQNNVGDGLEKSLEFFKLNSTFDIFDGLSDDEKEESCDPAPALFNRSLGIFNSSSIYQPTQNVFQTPTKNVSEDLIVSDSDTSRVFSRAGKKTTIYQPTQNVFQTPTKNDVSEDLIVSDSDTSPVFTRTGNITNLRRNSQRKLFSQTLKTNNKPTSEKIESPSKLFSQTRKNNNKPTSEESRSPSKLFSHTRKNNKPTSEEIRSPSKLFKFSSDAKNKIEPKAVQTKKNPILDLLAKASTSGIQKKSIEGTTPNKGLKNTLLKQLANSTPICQEKVNKENNIIPPASPNFWDESLFEICDSDENSDEGKEEKCSTENISNICDQAKESSDSDETIVLSFNSDVIEDLEKGKELTTNKTINTTDNSLLTVTQVIDFLSETKIENISKLSNTDDNNVKEKSSMLYNILSERKITKEEDKNAEIVSLIEDFNPSDDEFSLLSFSQNMRKKKQLQKKLSDKKINTDVICIDDDSNDLNLRHNLKENENITNFNIQTTFTNVFNSPKNYEEKETSLLNFSQNVKKVRHKKMKLQLQTSKTTKPETSNITLSQDSPIKAVKRTGGFKRPSVISDSDDDFETKPSRKEITPKRIKNTKLSLSYSKNATTSIQGNRRQKNCTKKQKLQFIDYEAAVSEDEHYISDSEEEGDDILESSFIQDTQSVMDKSDMQAKYLESIRSPKKISGFKMPIRPPPKVYDNIFSQEVNTHDDAYEPDSFCIDDDTTLTQRHGLSYLEQLEAQLERQQKREKRKRILRAEYSDSE